MHFPQYGGICCSYQQKMDSHMVSMATTQVDFWNTGKRSNNGHVSVNTYLQKQVAAEFKP